MGSIDLCLVVIIFYIVVCVCHALCRAKEGCVGSFSCVGLIKTLIKFIIDVVFCPLQMLIKVFKKKIVEKPVPVKTEAKKRGRKKKP